MHSSSVRSSFMSFDDTPHARRRQIAFAGTGVEGSSDSDSGVAGVAGLVGCAVDACGVRGTAGVAVESVPAFSAATLLIGMVVGSMSGLGSGGGASSTVECLPVVHGGIVKNSSKVRTRGLQHFQPGNFKNQYARRCASTRMLLEAPF